MTVSLFSLLILFSQVSAMASCIQAGQEQAEIKNITAIRKNSGFSTDPFLIKTFPPISFQNAALPTVWLGPEFFELVGEAKSDGKSSFQGICSKSTDQKCAEWCFLRTESPQFYSAQAQTKVIEQCQKCENSKDEKCNDVQFLKNSSDFLTINTFDKKPAILQMGSKGQLLVFQTDKEGKKDIKKPYLKLTQTINGDVTHQKLEGVGGGVESSSAAETLFKKNANYGYYGFRVCDQAILSLTDCGTQIKSTINTAVGFTCQPRMTNQPLAYPASESNKR